MRLLSHGQLWPSGELAEREAGREGHLGSKNRGLQLTLVLAPTIAVIKLAASGCHSSQLALRHKRF